MRHSFVLDENIVMFAVTAAGPHGESCSELIALIAENGHRIVVNHELYEKCMQKLDRLIQQPQFSYSPAAMIFFQLFRDSEKFQFEHECPEIPEGLPVALPRKDLHVVRAAIRLRPYVVTTDRTLREAINANHSILLLEAIEPTRAVELAKDK
jgi:hypothetical protein